MEVHIGMGSSAAVPESWIEVASSDPTEADNKLRAWVENGLAHAHEVCGKYFGCALVAQYFSLPTGGSAKVSCMSVSCPSIRKERIAQAFHGTVETELDSSNIVVNKA